MLICQACGTENRDKARFCMGCAKAIEPPTEAAAKAAPPQGPQQVCPACQASNPLAATVCKSCRSSLIIAPPVVEPPPGAVAAKGSSSRTMAMAGLVLVVLAVGAWWLGFLGRPGDAAMASSAPDTSATAAAPAAVAAASVPETASASAGMGSTTTTTAVAKATPSKQAPDPGAKETRKQRDRRLQLERAAAAKEAQRQAALEQQQREAQARQQRAEQLAAQQRAAEEKLAKVALQATAPARSVEQACASSGNFFAREVCKVKTCGDAAFARDPICIRFRETEAQNRRNPAY